MLTPIRGVTRQEKEEMTAMRRKGLLAVATAAAAAALALGLPTAAWAHVGVSGSSTAAGSSTLLTFAFSHGCGDSPTTRVAIQIPEGINAVAPSVNPGWTVEKVTASLDTPVADAHGNQANERVSQVVYTAKEPVPDGLRDAFVLSLTLPEDAAGRTLAFPTVQSCTVGENAWIELPAEGQDPHDLESPAPTLSVTEAVASDHGAGHETTAAGAEQNPLILVTLMVATLGLLTGGLALVQGRRKA
ncbi:MAG: YcnI family protein [Propionibacteriaceae bacterium]|nr:YcnI family protein [Propionibacteriaceae bacterium]